MAKHEQQPRPEPEQPDDEPTWQDPSSLRGDRVSQETPAENEPVDEDDKR